jgi:hypothetical protein
MICEWLGHICMMSMDARIGLTSLGKQCMRIIKSPNLISFYLFEEIRYIFACPASDVIDDIGRLEIECVDSFAMIVQDRLTSQIIDRSLSAVECVEFG